MSRNHCARVWKSVFAAALLLAAAGRGDDGDTQAWIRFWVLGDLTDRVGVKLAREERFRDSDESKYYYGYTDISVPVKLDEHWTLAPAVRASRSLRSGEWREDVMPHLTLFNKHTFGPVTLKHRMRLVKTYKEASDTDPVQYRHRLDVISAHGWSSWKIKPYVAEEAFYDFTDHDFNQSRTYTGLLFAPLEKVSFDLYVMREDTKKENEWHDILVFGLITGFEF